MSMLNVKIMLNVIRSKAEEEKIERNYYSGRQASGKESGSCLGVVLYKKFERQFLVIKNQK